MCTSTSTKNTKQESAHARKHHTHRHCAAHTHRWHAHLGAKNVCTILPPYPGRRAPLWRGGGEGNGHARHRHITLLDGLSMPLQELLANPHRPQRMTTTQPPHNQPAASRPTHTPPPPPHTHTHTHTHTHNHAVCKDDEPGTLAPQRHHLPAGAENQHPDPIAWQCAQVHVSYRGWHQVLWHLAWLTRWQGGVADGVCLRLRRPVLSLTVVRLGAWMPCRPKKSKRAAACAVGVRMDTQREP